MFIVTRVLRQLEPGSTKRLSDIYLEVPFYRNGKPLQFSLSHSLFPPNKRNQKLIILPISCCMHYASRFISAVIAGRYVSDLNVYVYVCVCVT